MEIEPIKTEEKTKRYRGHDNKSEKEKVLLIKIENLEHPLEFPISNVNEKGVFESVDFDKVFV